MTRRRALVCAALLTTILGCARVASTQTRESLTIRGHDEPLYLYGHPSGDPVILTSGDGGWIHLAPHVAALLAAHGFYVVGFDAKAYLSSFTTRRSTLEEPDEPGDYRLLAGFAIRATGRRPLLIGVSEGAGLSVLAATDPATQSDITGVVALGLPDLNELGWRWQDSLIYLTHRTPNEPTFSAAAVVNLVAPLPLAAVHSTHDEFVPLPEIERVLTAARPPKRLWIVEASDHRFSGNLGEFDRRLLDAIAWAKTNAPRTP